MTIPLNDAVIDGLALARHRMPSGRDDEVFELPTQRSSAIDIGQL